MRREVVEARCVRYHVLLEGSAGPDIELDHEPARDEILEYDDGLVIRVYGVLDGANGSKVINASRVGRAGQPWFSDQ